MDTGADLHVYYKVANAPVLPFPFPHMVVDDVFPRDFYRTLLTHLPAREAMTSPKALGRVGKGYPDTRFVLPLDAQHLGNLPAAAQDFWTEVARWMLSEAFANLMMNKFAKVVQERISGSAPKALRHEAMLVQDYSSYSLGPHTDRKAKVLSLLFYLPADDARPHLGTSLYAPRDAEFRCPGGPHYRHEDFFRIYTMSYRPNTMFAFPKTDYSFHGVERLTDADVRRDLLLYDIFLPEPPGDPSRSAAPAAASGTPA
jgi:hypothetical protein